MTLVDLPPSPPFTIARIRAPARSRKWRGLVLGISIALLTIEHAAAAYVLQPGDTLEMSVAGLSSLHDKAVVDVDGFVQLPLIAPIKASGLTVEQVLTIVRQDLPRNPLRQVQADGRDSFSSIDPAEISLHVAEYRPVYVRGDVDKPGEIRFRPGLTVRQAIALAGGFDTMHFRMENPFLQSSDLRAQYESLWIDYARNRAKALLIDAELRDAPIPDLLTLIKTPLAPSLLESIVSTEKQSQATELADFRKEVDYLRASAATAEKQMGDLIKPMEDAKLNETEDNGYKQSLQSLLDKGVIAHDRVAEQKRSMLESTQRFLDYAKRIQELQRSHDDLNRQAEHQLDEQRTKQLKELQEANTRTADAEARLRAVSEKMAYTGMVRSQLARGEGSSPEIVIYHQGSTNSGESGVSEDVVLSPGDTVDISLKSVPLVEIGTR